MLLFTLKSGTTSYTETGTRYNFISHTKWTIILQDELKRQIQLLNSTILNTALDLKRQLHMIVCKTASECVCPPSRSST